jgi:hypothetical protein
MDSELYWNQFFIFWTLVELALILMYVAVDKHLIGKVKNYARLFLAKVRTRNMT